MVTYPLNIWKLISFNLLLRMHIRMVFNYVCRKFNGNIKLFKIKFSTYIFKTNASTISFNLFFSSLYK